MSRRYTYSRTIDTIVGKETFSAVEFDSFDEGIKAVEKGIYERKLALTTEKIFEQGTEKTPAMPPVPPKEQTQVDVQATSRPLPPKK